MRECGIVIFDADIVLPLLIRLQLMQSYSKVYGCCSRSSTKSLDNLMVFRYCCQVLDFMSNGSNFSCDHIPVMICCTFSEKEIGSIRK